MDQSGYGGDAGFLPGPAPVTDADSAEVAQRGEVFAFFAEQAEAPLAPPAPLAPEAPAWDASQLPAQAPAYEDYGFFDPSAGDVPALADPAPVAAPYPSPTGFGESPFADAGFVAQPPVAPQAEASPYVVAASYFGETVPAQAAPQEQFGLEPQVALEPAVDYGLAPQPDYATAPRVAEPAPVALLKEEPPALEVLPLLAEAEADEAAYLRASTEAGVDEDDVSMAELLTQLIDRGASDLHVTAGAHPCLRISGSLVQLDDYPLMTPPVLQRTLYALMTQKQRERFEETLELDFSYNLPGRARFRVNVYRQRDALGAAFRLIPYELKRLEDLGIPPIVSNFAGLPRGFVLVTGPTGSGKSTTLASLVDLANRTRQDHIMTVEDPIEFLHRHQSCIVNQREVGEDTWSFQNALKHALRQDPDIILVGELRDLETISVALTAAETGHLVFATLHTQDAAQTVDRVIDVFPPSQQQQIRVQLAGALQGVVCQTLAKRADGRGRVVAAEVMVATPAIRNLIREGKTHQIYSAMQAGAKHGMQTMDQHLAELVRRGAITYEHGLEKCHHVEDFNRLLGRA